jgi:cytochrome c oxidase cbb3-type subunit 3
MARKPNEVAGAAPAETTGHSWDGIEELNNPLPRWWLWTFYGTIAWGLVYTILYPAWPLLTGATPGVLAYSTRAEVAAEIDRFAGANAALDGRLAAADVTAIAADPELAQYATSGGAAVFRTFCAQCHGAGAAGVQASGYPNLLDDDWLWGGDIAAIHQTIAHGIRWDADGDTRFSQMPAFGEMLAAEEIASIANHVLALSGQPHDAAGAAAGAVLFADNCAACHGEAGLGDREQGAPNLTDAIWHYGGDLASITAQITAPRNGRMPAWSGRLTDAQVKKVAYYVHQLGGGE